MVIRGFKKGWFEHQTKCCDNSLLRSVKIINVRYKNKIGEHISIEHQKKDSGSLKSYVEYIPFKAKSQVTDVGAGNHVRGDVT